ncbi:MAG: hypothetical protein AAFO07_25280 [Bacteroidota bacterium]
MNYFFNMRSSSFIWIAYLIVALEFLAVSVVKGQISYGNPEISTLQYEDPKASIDLSGFDPYYVEIGKHRFKPTRTNLYRHKDLGRIEYAVVFPESCEYDFEGDLDQWDWNKGAGLSQDWKRNDKDAIMWAWRYNVDSSRFELTSYVHRKYKRFIGRGLSDEIMLIANTGDLVTIEFQRYDDKKWGIIFTNHSQQFTNQIEVNLRKNPRYSRSIAPWFGGANNSDGPFGGVAPHDMILLIKTIHENF